MTIRIDEDGLTRYRGATGRLEIDVDGEMVLRVASVEPGSEAARALEQLKCDLGLSGPDAVDPPGVD